MIELSIVLIIIGLLIAGVTGGASLIQSAKVRSMINEIKDYERAVYTFQAARGRYPGDVKNYGTFGSWSNYNGVSGVSPEPFYTYQASDFPSDFLTEFQKTAGSGVVPNFDSAPFAELYNEGIIDFRPLGNAYTGSKKGVPSLKSEPNTHFNFSYIGKSSTYKEPPCAKGAENCHCRYGLINYSPMKHELSFSYRDYSETKGIDPKFLKAVDEKIDDGWYSGGVLRGACYGGSGLSRSSYDSAIKNGKKCGWFVYVL